MRRCARPPANSDSPSFLQTTVGSRISLVSPFPNRVGTTPRRSGTSTRVAGAASTFAASSSGSRSPLMAENAFIRDYLCAVTQLPMMRPGAGVTGESRGLREALIPSPGDRAYVVSGPIGSLFETETPLGPWLRSLGGAGGSGFSTSGCSSIRAVSPTTPQGSGSFSTRSRVSSSACQTQPLLRESGAGARSTSVAQDTANLSGVDSNHLGP